LKYSSLESAIAPLPTHQKPTQSPIAQGINTRQLKWQILFLLCLMFWVMGANAYRGAVSPDGLYGYDFRVIHEATQRLSEGKRLYIPVTPQNYLHGVYIYSPFVAVVLKPLSALSLENAMKIWAALNVFFLFAAIGLFARAVRFSTRDAAALAVTVFVSFHFWPTVVNFGLGQFNVVMLPLIAALFLTESRYFTESSKHQESTPANFISLRSAVDAVERLLSNPVVRDITWGIVLAIAVLIKTWMVGLVFYLLIQRRWRSVGVTAASYAIISALLYCLVGWHELPGFIRNTLENTSQPWLVSNSITGFARLHLAPNQLKVQPLLTDPLFYRAFVLLGYGTVAAALVALWRRGPTRNELESRLVLGFLVASLLLMTTLCHIEYFVLCLPLLWTLLAQPQRDAGKIPLRMIAAAALLYILFTRPWPHSPGDLPPYGQGLKSLFISMPFLTNIALCVLAWFAIRYTRDLPEIGSTKVSQALLTQDIRLELSHSPHDQFVKQ
jgi:hypothetical protein